MILMSVEQFLIISGMKITIDDDSGGILEAANVVDAQDKLRKSQFLRQRISNEGYQAYCTPTRTNTLESSSHLL
jgi:hypothetical protein